MPFIDIFEKRYGAGDTQEPVKVASIPVVREKEVAIIKPGQVLNPVYINGIPYYNVLTEYTDEGGRREKKKQSSGYVKKDDFDALNITTVSIPANFAGLEAEMVPTRLMEQLFRIVSVVENEDYVEVTARHVWYDNLKNFTLWEVDKDHKDTDYSAGAVCRNILTNAISRADSNVATDCTDTKKGKEFDYKNKNIVEAFLDPENGVCAKFGLSLIRYNWDFYCLKEVGYDRGFVVENGKNLLGVERTESIENLVTRVAPFGQSKDGKIIWLDNNGVKYVDSQYIGDYSCPHVELLDTGLKIGDGGVTQQNIQEKLLEAGQKRFTEDHADIPEVEMTIEFLSLGDTEEYAQYRGLDKVYLYDIITIHDTVRGYNYTAQVVGVEHDILTGMLTSVTIGKLNNWDGTRKVATWQVPEVNGENIRLQSIQAGAFAPGAIFGDDIAEAVISYAHFASATINELTADSIEAVTAQIHEIIAGSITADDIQAGSITTATLAAGAVTAEKIAAEAITSEKIHAEAITAGKIAAGAITTEKLAAGAVTAAKLDAGAVTADKIAAGSISASKIDTTDLSAINATLGTADIADARIGIADINFAHIKDLNASSAFFGQTIFNEAVGGKLYVPRLSVGYAQMIGATISDLVIQASDDKYYRLDVAMNGDVTATEVQPSAEEIAQGHTNDGRTIYIGTDILATDLNTENIYAGHALMDEITAAILNVDQLFAREATIGKINALDLSSNTYIRSVVGDWVSGSTITQTINSINTRITSLGYGTFYYSETEPSHEGLVAGDVWIKPLDSNSWGDIAEMTWRDVSTMTWDEVLGKYEMYAWTGQRWKLLYDSRISADLQTQINQNAYAITLKADQSVVDTLSGDVSEFASTLEVQSEAITSAVSAVNAKSSNYVQPTDPASDPTIQLKLGDTWTAVVGEGLGTWRSVSGMTWRQVSAYNWEDIGGARTFAWDGTKWVPIATRGLMLNQSTQIKQTAQAIEAEAQSRLELGNQVTSLSSRLTITDSKIETEVQRAQTAENSKISKTSTLQTADDIVTAAERYTDGILTSKSAIEQTATGITAYVQEYTGDHFYEIRSGIDIKAAGVEISGAKYIKIKSGGSFSVDSGNFSIGTNGSVTVTGTITATSITANQGGSIAGWSIAANRLSSGSGAGYVAIDSNPSGTYAIWAGNATAENATFWVKRNGQAKFSGTISAAAGSTIGGWTLGSNDLHSGSSGSYVALASSGTYAMWAGAQNSAAAPFRLKPDGTVYLTKLIAIGETGSESEVNLRTAGLWKLNYNTVKSYSTDGQGYCSGMSFSNGASVNFKSAASVDFGSETLWSDGEKTLTLTNGKTKTVSVPDPSAGDWSGTYIGMVQNVPVEAVTVIIAGKSFDGRVSAQGAYDSGVSSVTVSGIERQSGSSFSDNSKTVYFNVRGTASNGAVGSWTQVSANVTQSYNTGWNDASRSQSIVGTCYQIIEHGSGDWVKVRSLGTGYTQVTPIY